MTSLHTPPWSHAPQAQPSVPRRAASRALLAASAALAHLARRLALPAPRTGRMHLMTEFHADAGAPEGALYVDGRLVGFVAGVTRL